MRKTILATAVATALGLSAAGAHAQPTGTATRAEMEALQAQMRELAERLNRLEAANTELQAENAELRAGADRRAAEVDYLKAQTRELREEGAVASGEIGKIKGTDWAARIKARGDLRYRHETIMQERIIGTGETATVDDAADRHRHRIRARLGFDATVTDDIKATLLFATGGDDPRSANQTLGGTSTRKSIGLDMAYADWRFMPGGNLVLGKQPNPLFRPGQSQFYDSDVNPEGAALRFDRGMLFGTAYGWWVTEQFNADPAADNTDARIYGVQAGLKFPALGGDHVLAANYYECASCQGHSPLYANNANGNTTYRVGTSATNLLAYRYDVLEFGAQSAFSVADRPLTLWANYAQNLADEVQYDTAWAYGAVYGRASNAGSWEIGAFYQSVDKDALFGQWVESDFADGRTDSDGWVVRAGYAPVRNLTLNASYYLNTMNKDVGTELDYERLQLDLNYKF